MHKDKGRPLLEREPLLSAERTLDYRPWTTEAQGDLGSARADTALSPLPLSSRGVSLSNNASRQQYNGPIYLGQALRKLSCLRQEEDAGKFRSVRLHVEEDITIF